MGESSAERVMCWIIFPILISGVACGFFADIIYPALPSLANRVVGMMVLSEIIVVAVIGVFEILTKSILLNQAVVQENGDVVFENREQTRVQVWRWQYRSCRIVEIKAGKE